MIRTILTALVFGALFIDSAEAAVSHSKSTAEETRSPKGKPTETQQATTRNEGVITPPPIVVNVLPTPKTKEEAAEERREREANAVLDGKLLDLTGDLAFYTAGLFAATIALFIATAALVIFARRQARDMRASLAVTRDAANAAMLSAQALPLIETAYMFVEITKSRGLASNREGLTNFEVEARISNHGKTPAIISMLRGIQLLQETAPTELPIFQGSDSGIPDGIMVGVNYTYPLLIPRRFTSEEIEEIQRGTKTLYCCGVVKYRDVLNSTQSG